MASNVKPGALQKHKFKNIHGTSFIIFADPPFDKDVRCFTVVAKRDILSACPNPDDVMSKQCRKRKWVTRFRDKDGVYAMQFFARIEEGNK